MFKKIFSIFLFFVLNISFVFSDLEKQNIFGENFLQIKNEFQNPTYLKEKDAEKEEYICEEGECKVNFDFRKSVEGKEKNYKCEFSFAETVEETCNPNTILVEKTTEFKIKIISKTDEKNFAEKIIKIVKAEKEEKEENPEKEGKTEEKEKIEIKNEFQNPTYLKEKDEEKEEYICEKLECKVNFDFRKSVEGKEKDYKCEFSFAETVEETCNPNTILVEKTTEFKIKIISKTDEKNFVEKIIKIVKPEKEKEEKEENSEKEGKPEEKEKIEIKNEFQNPTYLKEKDAEKEDYICEKGECKVNFDFRKSFEGKEKDYKCEFSFAETVEETCNPNTILVEKTIEFKIKIISKIDEKNFVEKIIKIVKAEKEEKEKKENISGSQDQKENSQKIIYPKIKVQSGLKDNLCDDKECKVNFIFETKDKNLACEWYFGNGYDYKETYKNKCNPGSLLYGPGKHIVILKVFDKNNPEKVFEDFLEFENIYDENKDFAKIVLTGKSEKFQISKSKAVCFFECELDFGLEEISKNAKKFVWDFGNGETFEGKNPKKVIFKKGNYNISLKIYDKQDDLKQYFFEVFVKDEKDLNFFEEIFFDKKDLKSKIKLRKNKNFLKISGESKNDILLILTENTSVFGKYIYYEEKKIIPDENGFFEEKINYSRIGDFSLDFFEILDNEKIFLENKKVQFFEKDYFNFLLSKLEKEQKELKKKDKKKKKNTKIKKEKVKEKYFLEIILQGKLTKNKKKNGKNIVCNGPCSLNFGLKTNIKSSKNIVWDLGFGEKFIGKNPKSKKYLPGKYKIEVEFKDEKGEILKDYFLVKVNKKIKKKKKRKTKKKKFGPVKLEIKVQGRIGKNKILLDNKLICYKTCSVNFDGRSSSGAYKELIWDFGNGEKFVGENPKSTKYKNFGKYKVVLKTFDFKGKKYEKYFEVEFLEQENSTKNSDKKEFENKNKYLQAKNFKKDDFIFIFVIIFLIFSGSVILLKRHKIF